MASSTFVEIRETTARLVRSDRFRRGRPRRPVRTVRTVRPVRRGGRWTTRLATRLLDQT